MAFDADSASSGHAKPEHSAEQREICDGVYVVELLVSSDVMIVLQLEVPGDSFLCGP